MEGALAAMARGWARPGAVTWLGVRTERRGPVLALSAARVLESGLDGDRRDAPGKRAVTLLQAEHLAVIAALCARRTVEPALLRRNVLVAGINLLGLRGRRFRLGEALLEGTGLCAPCSRMEEALGPGGYAAVRGHGGITARVVEPGFVQLGDAVVPADD